MNAEKVCILLVCVLFFVSVVPIKADAVTVTLDNDGSPMGNPYGQCEVKPSFDADYYDCYIPYNMTCEEIGGIATVMQDYIHSAKISGRVNYEGTIELASGLVNSWGGGLTPGYCENTDVMTMSAEDGTQYYVAAIPSFCYRHNLVGTNNFYGWSLENRGQLYDLILTDGTVLHFVVGDVKADAHTNGGGEVDDFYSTNTVNYEQYYHLFQAEAGETLEVFGNGGGCVSKFMDYYNIGNGDDQNRIAYIRMYNIRLRDCEVVREDGIPAGVGYTHDGVTIVANPNANNDDITITDENGNPISVNIVPESSLTGMPESVSIGADASDVALPDRENLTISELNSLQSSKDAIEARNSIKVFDFARHAMVFLGLLLMVYVLLILLSAMFDRVNSFIDISLVSLFTFGAIKVSNEEETKGQVGYASNTKLYVSIGVMAVVSALLISGAVIPGVMKAVQWAFDGLSGIF